MAERRGMNYYPPRMGIFFEKTVCTGRFYIGGSEGFHYMCKTHVPTKVLHDCAQEFSKLESLLCKALIRCPIVELMC